MKDFIDSLYSDIGKRIKSEARATGSFVLIAGSIIGIILLIFGFVEFISNEHIGLLISGASTLIGSYFYFLISRLFYGFGQLVDDVHSKNFHSDTNTFEGLPKI